MRLDLHFSAPVFERPVSLGPILQRAIGLMDGNLTKYGSSGPFAPSNGRKPRKTDITQFGETDVLLKSVWLGDIAEKRNRRAHLKEHGFETEDHNFKPIDHGDVFLGDRLPTGDSDTHFQLLGFGAWVLSFSFGLDLAAAKSQEILSFADDIMTSGLASSGFFGFAINGSWGMPNDSCERHYLTRAKQFPLLNPVYPARLCFLEIEERAIAPIGPWYVLDNDWAFKNGLDPDEVVRVVSDQVHAIIDTPNGRLFKLWEKPILGENFGTADLSPALALGRALAPAMHGAYHLDWGGNKNPHSLRFCYVGEYEQRQRFYTRFCQSAGG